VGLAKDFMAKSLNTMAFSSGFLYTEEKLEIISRRSKNFSQLCAEKNFFLKQKFERIK